MHPSRIISIIYLIMILVSCKKDKKQSEQPIPAQPQPPKTLVLETVQKKLDLPWGLAFLPTGDLLFTERPGRINLLKKNDSLKKVLYTAQVQQNGEGGILGICVDPQFNSNHFIYAYVTTDSNRVLRFSYQNETLQFDRVILGGIPQAQNHNGGALKFGPDGYLYVGTGDAIQANLAQNKQSFAGKILRITRDGGAAPGNPFQNRLWSYGHRNVQGFTWTQTGTMLATEHGPSGENGWFEHDEINLILPGNNYGWPLALGGTESDSLSAPLIHSGNEGWAPSGCTWLGENAIWPNCLVVTCLRGEKILRVYIDPLNNQVKKRSDTLEEVYGRLRNIVENQDGSLFIGSSNRPTGEPQFADDDKIYKIYLK